MYNNISLTKVAKILNINEKDLRVQLDSYKSRNSNKLGESKFEDNVIKRLLGENVQIDFEIKNDMLTVTESIPERDHMKNFAKLNK
jgi:hypothetical protein